MTAILGSFAVLILIVYSLYFSKILRGNPHEFELDLLHALENWLHVSKSRVIWILGTGSALCEAVYFGLVFWVIDNPVTLALTGLIIIIELWHLFSVVRAFGSFFKGAISAGRIFNWRLERLSAMGFFTHSLIVILTLIFMG